LLSNGQQKGEKQLSSYFRLVNQDKPNSYWVYMLRTSQQHHVQLTSLIDQKASILIASSSIIITISFTHIQTAKGFYGFWLLMITALLTLITSIIVIAPISLKKRKQDTIKDQQNPLFFGHFTTLSFHEFEAEMLDIMDDAEKVKRTMIKDVYQIGKVLSDRKYPYLKASSLIFILGLITSLTSFALEYFASK
jgi:hypothetical protein